MKKLLAILIACTMLFLAEGCGKSAPKGQEGVVKGPQSRRDRDDQRREKANQTAPAEKTEGAAKQ